MQHLRGKFIVFDGTEGCGKSTQVRLLQEKLEAAGASVLAVRDPGSTRIGEQIRQILLNPEHDEMGMRCEMLLYMAARAQMMVQTILPALGSGKTVICDRFISSTLAYQGGGDGLKVEEITAVGDIAVKGRWPDMTFILDLPVEVSMARVKPKFLLPFPAQVQSEIAQEMCKDRIELRPTEYHETVRRNYLEQARAHPERYRVVDATQPAQKVHEKVMKALGRG
jgi:dTMP kinase